MGEVGLGWVKRGWDWLDWVDLEGLRCVWLVWTELDWVVLARVGLGWVICAGTLYGADTWT